MDAGIAIRPTSGVTSSDFVRPASVPLQPAAVTELDPSKAVTAVTTAAAIRNDKTAAQEALSRTHLIDPQTRAVIMRVVDTRTHQVVRQTPDQALLRMRAYAKALAQGQTPVLFDPMADLAV